MTYASETWVLKETVIQKLLVFERKILRIFGPTKENQIWRVKTNEKSDKLIKHKNIINYIKAQRLSWFGHVQRMPDTRTVKKIFNPLNAELNPICYLLALLAHHFLHVSRIRVKSLTLRLLMSYIYMECLFLMFLDHTRRSTVGRTPLDE